MTSQKNVVLSTGILSNNFISIDPYDIDDFAIMPFIIQNMVNYIFCVSIQKIDNIDFRFQFINNICTYVGNLNKLHYTYSYPAVLQFNDYVNSLFAFMTKNSFDFLGKIYLEYIYYLIEVIVILDLLMRSEKSDGYPFMSYIDVTLPDHILMDKYAGNKNILLLMREIKPYVHIFTFQSHLVCGKNVNDYVKKINDELPNLKTLHTKLRFKLV